MGRMARRNETQAVDYVGAVGEVEETTEEAVRTGPKAEIGDDSQPLFLSYMAYLRRLSCLRQRHALQAWRLITSTRVVLLLLSAAAVLAVTVDLHQGEPDHLPTFPGSSNLRYSGLALLAHSVRVHVSVTLLAAWLVCRAAEAVRQGIVCRPERRRTTKRTSRTPSMHAS